MIGLVPHLSNSVLECRSTSDGPSHPGPPSSRESPKLPEHRRSPR